jgi:hypothetical protein
MALIAWVALGKGGDSDREEKSDDDLLELHIDGRLFGDRGLKVQDVLLLL